MQVRKTFLFNSKRDSEILEWLYRQDNASEAVREALRLAIDRTSQTITLEDIYNELCEIRRQGITTTEQHKDDNVEEPPDIVDTLNKLGL